MTLKRSRGQSAALRLTLSAAALLSFCAYASAQSLTPGSLVVERFGTGAAALTSAATPVFLDQLVAGTGASAGSSIALPTTASNTGNAALTESGTAGSDGFLKLSPSGLFLTLGGYNVTAGASGVASTVPSATANQRVIGRVDANGFVDTTTSLSDAFSANNIRGTITVDGTSLYVAGAGSATGGVRLATPSGSTTSTQIASTPTSERVLNIFNGQLYVTSNAAGNIGINTVGSGIPTTGSQTVTLLPVSGTPAGTGTASPYDFYFSVNPVSSTVSVYLTDDRTVATGGGLQKYTFDGTTLTYQYTLSAGLTAGLHGLAGTTDALGNATLYATTADAGSNKVVSLVDAGSASSFTTLATAPTNEAYRGISFAPVAAPEPAGTATLAWGGALLIGALALRRRRMSAV